MKDNSMEIPDMSAKEMYDNLFNLDFLSEEERETIYKATELYAKGKVRVATQPHLSSKELEEWVEAEAQDKYPEGERTEDNRRDYTCYSKREGFKSGCTAMQLHLQGEIDVVVMQRNYLLKDQEEKFKEIERLKGLIEKAYNHAWFQRERYGSQDRGGYENRFPTNWSDMDYEEKQDWFCEQFKTENNLL